MYKTTINWKKFFANIIVLALVVSITCLYFFTDIFRTKRGAFYKYFNQIPTALKVLDTDDYKDYSSAKKQYAYVREAEMIIQSSENYADSNILDKIKYIIKSEVDYKERKSDTNIEIKQGNNSISNISFKRQSEIYALNIRDVTDGYIAVNKEKLTNFWGALGKNYATELMAFNYDELLDISKTEKNHLNDFFKMIKSVQNTSYKKEYNKDIKIDDEEYTTTAYILELNGDEFATLEIEMLNKLVKDSVLMNYIASKCRLLNLGEKYSDVNNLNKLINARISRLQTGEIKEKDIKISIYENKRNNLRTEIKYGNDIYVIDHIKNDNVSKMSFKKNEEYMFKLSRKDNKEYNIYVENNSDLKQTLEIKYNQEGNLQENTIKNTATIIRTEGIKKVSYLYKDTISFNSKNNISKLDVNQIKIISDYNESEIKEFVTSFKERANKI